MQLLSIDIIDDQNLLDRFAYKKASNRQTIITSLELICRRILNDAEIYFGQINIVIVDSQTMQKYNTEFLGHDYVTDVISFPIDYKESYGKNGIVKKNLEADILICTDMAFERAKEFMWSPLEEFFLYAIHGTLHLAGYDDKDEISKKIMQQKESEYSLNVKYMLNVTREIIDYDNHTYRTIERFH
ncbi:MAG: rRNA maturation RNase YbeY [Planctomycetaceae bacterium]|nr:rRNA maturation RNase YbeY [Planctomycetaceae bacterium]